MLMHEEEILPGQGREGGNRMCKEMERMRWDLVDGRESWEDPLWSPSEAI